MKRYYLQTVLCTMLSLSSVAFAYDGFEKYAQSYADTHGVTIVEAKRALNIEMHKDDIMEQIISNYHDRLAGVYIDHVPSYTIVVRLLGDGCDKTQFFQLANGLPNQTVPVRFVYGAKITQDAAALQIDAVKSVASKYLTGVQMISYNPMTGKIDIEVNGENTPEMQSKIAQLQDAWQNTSVDLNVILVSFTIKPMLEMQ
ncbi:hypothetical protein NGM44_08955 [Moraxella sp. FZFQ2102]|uniref:hypothetical protein n=1 Tax=Moraxella sp. FZFQ2102 TaxID=2953752 RepID=UPI00209BBF90|nr:hypothetical protein [Moraxella sp. FZFQ2102]USZ14484.1 hypothetical protein NGM44_08955 [Moraxella sp. FZFQ2102]